jgi:hypothetical protein
MWGWNNPLDAETIKRIQEEMDGLNVSETSPSSDQTISTGSKGTKFDTDKLRLDLIPAEGEEGLGEAFTYGVTKYGDNNWREGLQYSRLIGAIARHLRAFKEGEDRDKESGLYHVDSIAATAMMLSTFLRENRTDLDNRYKKK